MIKIMKRGEVSESELFARKVSGADVAGTVAEIIADVRQNGDAALRKYNEKFDKCTCGSLEVSEEEFAAAMAAVPAEYLRVLERSAGNIREYHLRQVRHDYIVTAEDGSVLGQRVLPMARVGLYVPGGTAAYPSSVLMNCIPAKIAGVGEIVMTTPASGGEVSPAILAAAKVAGVDRVFKVGGAQAVAALAYGTESVPRVDKIVGPGNAFVAEAKRQVYGQVAIDMIAGPSEILIVSDGKTNAKWLAADMLSQAEHDKLATAILITDSAALAAEVAEEIERQLAALPREEIARASIENNGKIIVAGDLEDAVAIANEIAPEHLELCVDAPFDYLGKVKNAGSIFLGRYSPEPVGDYLAGTNHTLPTMGTARFSSPLSVDDFVKKSCFSYYTPAALEAAADDIALFADAEGLHGHAVSATIRREG
ncbi:MAG TPA: histidinol dehydrogenase [Candidatus Scatomorpha intestinavium]|uniref:Histidinol dehydrogenase n=1 Tax=Candidatus Scatomorpha intestinavium TaxID=2840922 RepID=A0A9D1CS09_9FIRM|nr:histidinol dehydrogenase [Candidatus Scatomorpha intestinavium]